MCHKIRCDGESWNLFGFQVELNEAVDMQHNQTHYEKSFDIELWFYRNQ